MAAVLVASVMVASGLAGGTGAGRRRTQSKSRRFGKRPPTALQHNAALQLRLWSCRDDQHGLDIMICRGACGDRSVRVHATRLNPHTRKRRAAS
jgi:hypothetical protein